MWTQYSFAVSFIKVFGTPAIRAENNTLGVSRDVEVEMNYVKDSGLGIVKENGEKGVTTLANKVSN